MGEFLKNKQHGRGVFIYANGNRYEGDYSDGRRHGRGLLAFFDGRRYEGEFKYDK